MKRIRGSGELRVLKMFVGLAPGLAVASVALALADGALPNLVIVAMGHATGRIPAAVHDGLGSAAGHALVRALLLAGLAYAVSLLRSPARSALAGIVRGRMTAAVQGRLVTAVAAPAYVSTLEHQAVADRLESASGELGGDRLADAPMTLLAQWGTRLEGVVSCGVLMTFRWWVGALLLGVWLVVRRPSRAFVVSRVSTFRRATTPLRQSRYLLRLAVGPRAAKEVRVFGAGGWLVEGYRERWVTAMHPSFAELARIQWRIGGVVALVLAAYLACAGALAHAAHDGQIDLRTLAVMLPMLPMSMQLGSVSQLEVQLAGMLATLPDLESLETELSGGDAVRPGGQRASERPQHRVVFDAVRFAYDRDEVLAGLDLTLDAGRSLALVGANGAGKTTLVALLAGLLPPTGGRLLVDGTPTSQLDVRAWQRQVAVVGQDALRLPLTARENVALDLDGEGADSGALRRAAARAGATGVVERLPQGWETRLSARYEGGVDVSGGEWQRLVLARALYAVERGARVLVLDEPTAQLDVRGEAAFYDRFLELVAGTTCVVVSHRFSTVRRADRIAVLDGGRIAELGSHDELMGRDGAYAQMFRMQAEAFA